MYKDVKNIMHTSFKISFFENKNDMNSNYDYLDALVEYVLANNTVDKDDYEKIATLISICDNRVKDVFLLDLGIVTSYLEDIPAMHFDGYSFKNELTIDDVKRIYRLSKSIEEYEERAKIARYIINWDNLNDNQRNYLIESLVDFLDAQYGVKICKGCEYKVGKYGDDILCSVAINKLISWMSKRINISFFYQTKDSVSFLGEYEKYEMYYQLGEELKSRSFENVSRSISNNIADHVIIPVRPIYEADDNEYVFSEMTKYERESFDALLYLQDTVCRVLMESAKQIGDLDSELRKQQILSEKQQCKIESLQKEIVDSQVKFTKVNAEKEKTFEELNNKIADMETELFSLREYMFSNQNHSDECIKEITTTEQEYKGGYQRVVIVGGHTKWRDKVLKNFEGINILNTDQNVIDWKFLEQIDVIVVVTNYISHSMYYRLLENVKRQRMLYINYKNIDHMKREIDNVLVN